METNENRQQIRRKKGLEQEQILEILVIEDDEMLNAGICYNLQAAKFAPLPAYDLQTARDLLQEHTVELILLDVNLPDGDGFTFARKLRDTSAVPIIFLTARDQDSEMVQGFEFGADDYIVKPFNMKNVIQRIQAVLRRSQSIKTPTVFLYGNLAVDFEAGTASKNGEPLLITPTEYRLLRLFCQNPGQVLTRNLILEKLWDNEGNFADEHALTIQVSRLRSKIEDGTYSYIKTIYGMGYKWVGDQIEP